MCLKVAYYNHSTFKDNKIFHSLIHPFVTALNLQLTLSLNCNALVAV